MTAPRVAVIQFPGVNCEAESARARTLLVPPAQPWRLRLSPLKVATSTVLSLPIARAQQRRPRLR